MTALQVHTDSLVNQIGNQLTRVQGSVELHDVTDALEAATEMQRLCSTLLTALQDDPA